MGTYIALLRGINVGGNNSLPMKELSALLEANEFNDVKTYIQSGNVVFNTNITNIDDTIAALIEGKFGFKPHVMVLEKTAFEIAVSNNPFSADEGKTIHFYFCKTKANINQEKLAKYQSDSEQVHLNHDVFYIYAPEGIGRSKLVANIETCLGVQATGRNLNTVNKITQMLENI